MSDPKCAELHPGPVLADDVVVDREGHVRWAFVYVDEGPLEARYKPPRHAALVDLVGCRFEPHVLGVMKNQSILFRNKDPVLHSVHAMPFENAEFLFGLPPVWKVTPSFGRRPQPQEVSKTFRVPEVMVKIKCDIHPWMTLWVGVLGHPYFSVSDEAGRYAIRGLPPGRFRLRLWHEKFAGRVFAVDVPEDGEVEVDLNLFEQRK